MVLGYALPRDGRDGGRCHDSRLSHCWNSTWLSYLKVAPSIIVILYHHWGVRRDRRSCEGAPRAGAHRLLLLVREVAGLRLGWRRWVVGQAVELGKQIS